MAKQSYTPKVSTKKHIARLERERRQVALIRWIALGGIILVALLLVYGYLNLNVFSLRQPITEVNGVEVTTREWQERVRMERVSLYNQLSRYQFFQQNFGMDTSQQQQQISFELNSPEAIGQKVLDTMVDEVLIRQEAEKRGITVSPEEVDNLLHESYGYFPNGTATPTVTPTEFSYPTLTSQQLTLYPSTATPTEFPTSAASSTSTPDASVPATATSTAAPATPTFVPLPPTATSTPYTLEGYQGQYEETLTQFKEYGISEETLRSVYEIQILREKLQADITKDETGTDVQVLARHILVATEADAATVYALLQGDTPFAKVAADFSQDTGSATNGGDLGWTPASTFVPEFAEAVKTLPLGEVSKPVKTEFGYHIIEVIAREELPLTASQLEQKKLTAFNEWLETARESATITTNEAWRELVPTEPVLAAPQ